LGLDPTMRCSERRRAVAVAIGAPSAFATKEPVMTSHFRAALRTAVALLAMMLGRSEALALSWQAARVSDS